jgi:chromatin remodeling complex protein RSC6
MVRASKSTPVANVPAPAPVEAVDPKKSAKKAAPAKAAPAPVKEVDAVPAPSADAAVDEVVADDLIELLNSYGAKIFQAYSYIATLKAQFKTLQKAVVKAHKTAQKVSNRKNKRAGNRKPSGFVRPTMISGELATFLGKPAGTEMARTDVSREINLYIRSHNLQDKANGRKINADAKLSTLLKLTSGDELTYFNLQRYLKPHFVKTTPPTA